MPSAMFVCIHNAGRSQLGAGLARALSGGALEVRSAGTGPDSEVHPLAVAALAEKGIDISAERPKALTIEAVAASDVVVVMGAGDISADFPGAGRYEQWDVDGAPSGADLTAWRPVRDEIERRVRALLRELGIPAIA